MNAEARARTLMADWRRYLADTFDPGAPGVLLHRGSSEFNSAPIGVVAVRLEDPSTNVKTGDMVQVYIMPLGISPLRAVHSGYDEAVCGACWMRPLLNGGCYVNVAWGAGRVHRCLEAGVYPEQWEPAWFRGALVRVGAWGDPAGAPLEMWQRLLSEVHGFTAYTHAWRGRDVSEWGWCMASVDSVEEQREAAALGWRTFRAGDEAGIEGERLCLAESHGISCAVCLGCGSRSMRRGGRVSQRCHYRIPRHGPRKAWGGGQGLLFDKLPLKEGESA